MACDAHHLRAHGCTTQYVSASSAITILNSAVSDDSHEKLLQDLVQH